MTPVSHGKPCAGNPHARFEEGASAPESPRRNALLHNECDEKYLEVFLAPLRICADYLPAFGTSGNDGLSLSDFQKLYGGDEFYSWIGLDSPLVYAAHKASGGLTSIYRQIGVGAERLLREIVKDEFSLSQEEVEWKYEYNKTKKKKAFHILDARISLVNLKNDEQKERVKCWLANARKAAHGDARTRLRGAIFEIRQGYKSADSKRQNADLRFGARSYQNGHIPVVAVLSSQVSETVIGRYRDAGMLVLTGVRSSDPTVSTFAFFKEIVGYDLESFFVRSSRRIKKVIHSLIEKLLSPE